MSAAELNEKHNKDRARQALYWQKKNEEKAKNNVVLSLKVKIYKTPQAYGKALKKVLLLYQILLERKVKLWEV